MKRIANDPTALACQSAYTAGTYYFAPTLATIFAQIADDIMRISK